MRLTVKDLNDFTAQRRAILKLLSGGGWYGLPQIRKASKGASECLRRLRDLRKVWVIECQNFGGRDFRYRLVGKK